MNFFIINILQNLVLKLGGQTTKVLDKGSIELLGPYGLEKGLVTLSKNIASLRYRCYNKLCFIYINRSYILYINYLYLLYL